MNAVRFLTVLVALLCIASARASVSVGDTREEALRQHGFPRSNAKRGNREYFVYPNGGRIEFAEGKVVDVKGPLPVIAAAAAESAPAAAAKSAPASPPPPAKAGAAPSGAPTSAKVAVPAGQAPPPSAVKAAPSPAALPPSDPNAAALAALSAHIEKMDSAWGETPKVEHEPSPLESIPLFLLGLVLRFGLTIAALKLAFKFWEMDAFWKGIFAIAGIDLALHAAFQLLGPVTGGFTTIKAVENGVPGLVLIYTINRFCFNKRIQNAVMTASATKLAIALLYIVGGIAMLNAGLH